MYKKANPSSLSCLDLTGSRVLLERLLFLTAYLPTVGSLTMSVVGAATLANPRLHPSRKFVGITALVFGGVGVLFPFHFILDKSYAGFIGKKKMQLFGFALLGAALVSIGVGAANLASQQN